MAKPSSFVRATLMPAAAAARSLARTARNRRPVAPRRRFDDGQAEQHEDDHGEHREAPVVRLAGLGSVAET